MSRINTKELLIELVKTDFKRRYRNSFLGFLWAILKPLLLFLTLYAVFSFFLGSGDPYYALNLFIGLIIFTFFLETTSTNLSSLVNNANLLQKINFPSRIIIFANVTSGFINLLIDFVVFFIFWLIKPAPIGPWMLTLPLYLILLAILTTGFSLLLSVLYIRFRDLNLIWEFVQRAWFYATPIFYPLSIVPEKLRPFIVANPFTPLIETIRNIAVRNTAPDPSAIVYVGGIAVVVFFIGFVFFEKMIKKQIELL